MEKIRQHCRFTQQNAPNPCSRSHDRSSDSEGRSARALLSFLCPAVQTGAVSRHDFNQSRPVCVCRPCLEEAMMKSRGTEGRTRSRFRCLAVACMVPSLSHNLLLPRRNASSFKRAIEVWLLQVRCRDCNNDETLIWLNYRLNKEKSGFQEFFFSF